MQAALAEARIALDEGNIPVGAVVVLEAECQALLNAYVERRRARPYLFKHRAGGAAG